MLRGQVIRNHQRIPCLSCWQWRLYKCCQEIHWRCI